MKSAAVICTIVPGIGIVAADFSEWRAQAKSFRHLAAYRCLPRDRPGFEQKEPDACVPPPP